MYKMYRFTSICILYTYVCVCIYIYVYYIHTHTHTFVNLLIIASSLKLFTKVGRRHKKSTLLNRETEDFMGAISPFHFFFPHF